MSSLTPDFQRRVLREQLRANASDDTSLQEGFPAIDAYPAVRRSGAVDTYGTETVADPYQWLEDVDSPEAAAFVQAQNQLSGPILAGLPGRQFIAERLTACYNYPKTTCPAKRGSNYVFRHNSGLQNQYVLQIQDSLEGSEPRTLLDPNSMDSEGTTALGATAFTKDGSLMAYMIAKAGSDWNSIRVLDVESGEVFTRDVCYLHI